MSLPAVFHDAADVELNDAADYYDLESPGLGTAFIDEVARVIAQLEEYPESAAPLHCNVRKVPLAKFPYSLLYSVKKDCIRILAVAHQRRRPFYWRGRSESSGEGLTSASTCQTACDVFLGRKVRGPVCRLCATR